MLWVGLWGTEEFNDSESSVIPIIATWVLGKRIRICAGFMTSIAFRSSF